MFDILDDLLEGLFVLFPQLRSKKERAQEWAGTVEAKRTWTLSKHAYLVIFRTDDGQRKKVRLDRKEDFDLYQEGRRYRKKAGRALPDSEPIG